MAGPSLGLKNPSDLYAEMLRSEALPRSIEECGLSPLVRASAPAFAPGNLSRFIAMKARDEDVEIAVRVDVELEPEDREAAVRVDEGDEGFQALVEAVHQDDEVEARGFDVRLEAVGHLIRDVSRRKPIVISAAVAWKF